MPRVKTIKSGNVEITLTDYSKELQNSLKKGCRDGYREASKNAKKDIKSFKDFKDKVHPKQNVSQPTVDYSNVSDEEIEKMLNSFKE